MRINERQLRRIIAEEVQNVRNARRNQPRKVTAEYLNRIIKEEYANFKREQRLLESRRRRMIESRRRRSRR